MNELLRETGSHYYANKQRWQFAASFGEIAAQRQVEVLTRVHHDSEQGEYEPPLYPWTEPDVALVIPDDELAALRAQLERRSALRDR